MVAIKEHCFYCFDILIAHLQQEQAPEAKFEDAS